MKISKMDMSPMLNAYPDSVENNIERNAWIFAERRSTGYFWKLLYFAKLYLIQI